MKILIKIVVLLIIICTFSCSIKIGKRQGQSSDDISKSKCQQPIDSVVIPEKIIIEKDYLYNQYTLSDVYPYKDTIRVFQWDKINDHLTLLEAMLKEKVTWGILQNYKNRNGLAPLVKGYLQNEYRYFTDTFGIERDQSAPLYLPGDTIAVRRYGRDGTLVKLVNDSIGFFKIIPLDFNGEWLVPKKYIKLINDTVVFDKAIFVDRTNQNIATLSREGSKWLIRSMNPATTGRHRPPFERETPVGIFVIQEKSFKMFFYKDGKKEIGGFAPYASRFSKGGYIHGIPVNEPSTKLIEFSSKLGTNPLSHMCVRNATSHAKFIYNWATKESTIVFIFD